MGLRREPGKVTGTLGGESELSRRPVDVERDSDLLPLRSPDTEMHATVRLAFRADGEHPSEPGIIYRRTTPRFFLREGSCFARWTAAHGVTSTSAVRNEVGGWPALSLAARSAGLAPSRGAAALHVPSRSRATRSARRAPSRVDMRARR